MVKEDLKEQGYTKEEEYFYQHNKRLIEKKRKELDQSRAELRSRELKTQHWMCCPKCGHQMQEVKLLGIMVDRCTSCDGVYFDRGELQLLLESKEPKGFLGGLRQLFK
jgi:hypothetical protein